MGRQMNDEQMKLRNVLNALRDQRFRPFIAYLEGLLAENQEVLANATDTVVIYRAQGRTAQLKEILEAVAKAANSR